MGTTGWAVMAVLCVVLIAAVVWVVATLVSRHDIASGVATAVGPKEILERRLASGEIDGETYDVLRAKLRSAPQASKP